MITAPLCPNLATLTDEQLVSRTLDGHKSAFDVLVARYQRAFTSLAIKLVRNDSEAQDIVQTAFLNMYRKLHTFRPGTSFRNWAYRVVTNTGLMELRKRKVRREVDAPELDRVTRALADEVSPMSSRAPASAETVMARKQLLAELERSMAQLPEVYAVVFRARVLEDKSMKEIADELGLSVPAVKSRLHRARLILKQELAHHL